MSHLLRLRASSVFLPAWGFHVTVPPTSDHSLPSMQASLCLLQVRVSSTGNAGPHPASQSFGDSGTSRFPSPLKSPLWYAGTFTVEPYLSLSGEEKS